MSGGFNTPDSIDGGWALTNGHDRIGFVGVSVHPDEPTPGGVGGCGLFGLSYTAKGAGVFGANNSTAHLGVGVQGNGPEAGVRGYSPRGHGVVGFSEHRKHSAIYGSNNAERKSRFDWGGEGPDKGTGVLGTTQVSFAAGVFGENRTASNGVGVYGRGPTAGVQGFSSAGVGVYGGGPTVGVQGFSADGPGLLGQSQSDSGAVLTSETGQALTAIGFNDIGVFAEGASWAGVFHGAVAISPRPGSANPLNGSLVVTQGDVFLNKGSLFVVEGDVFLGNADCAEEFDVSTHSTAEPGSVMVLSANGALEECGIAYDKRAVGVVSGAGDYRPAITLDKKVDAANRIPLALIGKVYCKVDASFAAIEPGDLLTASSTRGYAMRAVDQTRSFGAVIGKALEPCKAGLGLIRMLVALQ